MNYSEKKIVFQEVPDEVSLAFLINGCPLKCVGCHSSQSWNQSQGVRLDLAELKRCIEHTRTWITCVLFLGGEWHAPELIELLRYCQTQKLKTALYTGYEDVSGSIKENLDYIKVGPYDHKRGGLDSLITNQRFYNLRTGEQLNYKFISQSKED